MMYEISEMAKEFLYGIFGDVVYEIGLKRLALLILSPFFLVFLYFLYRFVRRSILQPIAASSRKLDQIAATVAENRRLLQALADANSPAPRGTED